MIIGSMVVLVMLMNVDDSIDWDSLVNLIDMYIE